MSESPPPPKKPGSLRDRIAAFESKQTAPAPAPTPGLRPKPGNVSWKPRPPSPSSSSPASTDQIPKGGGLSASDAKESISKAGSLKDRMAALKGKGAFGPPAVASAPIPKPASEKPKWKPPPKPARLSLDGDGLASAQTSPPTDRKFPTRRPSEDQQPSSPPKSPPAAELTCAPGDELDHEEEERQRRAAIAARMARLGGARLGMVPPMGAMTSFLQKAETTTKEAPAAETVPTTEGKKYSPVSFDYLHGS